jgi:hypothetical protein
MQKVYKDPVIALSTTDFDVPASYDPKQFQCTGQPAAPPENNTDFDPGI